MGETIPLPLDIPQPEDVHVQVVQHRVGVKKLVVACAAVSAVVGFASGFAASYLHPGPHGPQGVAGPPGATTQAQQCTQWSRYGGMLNCTSHDLDPEIGLTGH